MQKWCHSTTAGRRAGGAGRQGNLGGADQGDREATTTGVNIGQRLQAQAPALGAAQPCTKKQCTTGWPGWLTQGVVPQQVVCVAQHQQQAHGHHLQRRLPLAQGVDLGARQTRGTDTQTEGQGGGQAGRGGQVLGGWGWPVPVEWLGLGCCWRKSAPAGYRSVLAGYTRPSGNRVHESALPAIPNPAQPGAAQPAQPAHRQP